MAEADRGSCKKVEFCLQSRFHFFFKFAPSNVKFFLPPLPVKNRVRELRAAKKWSQSDLADKLGVSRQTVNAIETERYDPSLPLAFKVARLFKLQSEQVFSDGSE